MSTAEVSNTILMIKRERLRVAVWCRIEYADDSASYNPPMRVFVWLRV